MRLCVAPPGQEDRAHRWSGRTEVGSTPSAELARYDAVIHLRTPSAALGYNHANSLRVEPAVVAAEIDRRIEAAWRDHPRRFFVESREDFLAKAEALRLLRDELPECCRGHVVPEIDGGPRVSGP